MDSLVGQTIAERYRVLSVLGAGGMGVVYRAWDLRDKVPVVVKTPHAISDDRQRLHERFHREMQAMARLIHAHIVPIIDYGTVGDLPFIVMPYLPGGSLAERRRRDSARQIKPVPPGSLHAWLPAIASALDYLHAEGYVHRDVKPGNILFDAFARSFLGDFGLAKVVDDSGEYETDEPLTATLMAVGTHGFMAPEGFQPKAVLDGRVDQYSLAVTVYDMLAGRRPFIEEHHNLIVEIMMHPPPPLRRFVPGLPMSACQAIETGLAKDRAERFPSCTALANAFLAEIPPLPPARDADMPRLLCPSCKKLLKLPADIAGKRGPCPKCSTMILVAGDLGSLWLPSEQGSHVAEAIEYFEQLRPHSFSAFGKEGLRYLTDVFIRAGDVAIQSCSALLCGASLRRMGPAERRTAATAFTATAGLLVASLLLAAFTPVETKASRRNPLIMTSGLLRKEFEEFEDPLEEQIEVVDVPTWPAQRLSSLLSQVFGTAVHPALARAVEVTPPLRRDTKSFVDEIAPASEMLSPSGVTGAGTAGGFGGRANAARIAAASGGGADTEQAVDRALKWIVNHQMPDGGWSFDLKQCPGCQGQCLHSGDEARGLDRCGATAMAILPFLGRGYTHREGPYKNQIDKGMKYLANMTSQGKGKAYGKGGSLYSQGLAGIALSECYGMTQDARLAMPSQLALNFIMEAQDPRGGGWRYEPKQPGDTSAVGWQLMALKSGNMAYLQVNPLVIKKAVDFLNSVQEDEGAYYGYATPGRGPGTSAVGLLCRMYLGWKKDHPPRRGRTRETRPAKGSLLHLLRDADHVSHGRRHVDRLEQPDEEAAPAHPGEDSPRGRQLV